MLQKRFADADAVILNDKLIYSMMLFRFFQFPDSNINLAAGFGIFYCIACKAQNDLGQFLFVAVDSIMLQVGNIQGKGNGLCRSPGQYGGLYVLCDVKKIAFIFFNVNPAGLKAGYFRWSLEVSIISR